MGWLSSLQSHLQHDAKYAFARCPAPLPAANTMGSMQSAASAAGGPVVLGPLSLLLAALLLLVNVGISMWLQLGLRKRLVVQAAKSIAQLLVLGYVLVPIFEWGAWWVVLLYALFMVFVAAAEAVSRAPHAYQGMLLHVLGSLGGATIVVLSYGLLVVVRVQPWWAPHYLIPLLGLMLGNTLAGVSAGLAVCMEELTAGAEKVERLLALGATRREACRPLLQRAVLAAMAPSLSALSILSTITIPGMMSGLILGGVDPAQAAYYQIVAMLLITAATSLGSAGAVVLAVGQVVDAQHRLRAERLTPRVDHTAGVGKWMREQAIWLYKTGRKKERRLMTRLRLAYEQRAQWRAHGRAWWRGGRSLGQRWTSQPRGPRGGPALPDFDEASISSRLREVMAGGVGSDYEDSEYVLSDGDDALIAGVDGTPLLEAAPPPASRPTSPYSYASSVSG